MKKRLLSALTAMVMTLTAMPLCASADYIITTNPIDHSGYIRVDFMSDETSDFYIHVNEPFVILENKLNDRIYISTPDDDKKSIDTIKALFSGFTTENGDNIKVSSEIYDNDFREKYECYVTPFNDEKPDSVLKFTSNDARKIKELLNKNNIADNMIFANNVFNPMSGGRDLTHLAVSPALYTKELNGKKLDKDDREPEEFGAKLLQNYLSDKDYDVTLEKRSGIFLTPNKPLSLEEHLELLQEIYENCGLVMYCGYDLTTQECSVGVDLFNAVDGDANCDSVTDISDSVLIMQSLANPSHYSITAQGNFNADTDGDGITSGDALAIQKKLLRLDRADVPDIDPSLLANTLFISETEGKSGFNSISFGDDGRFNYFYGKYFSAAQDFGTWTISGDTVILKGQYGTNSFRYKDDTLICIAEDSEGFGYNSQTDSENFIKVKENS
ncbi:MAG: dockerin type I repeat-containing protein [Ruminococcus flavefaciens]